MEFIREYQLLYKLVIVDGIGKCGKSLFANILSSFNTVEKQDYNDFIEYIALAHKYNKISPDIAVAILKTQMDCALYNNMVGRQINTRVTDNSSLYNYHTPSKYIERSVGMEGSDIATKVLEEKPIYLTWSHDLINKSDVIFESFGSGLEFFYINRRPIDIIYEWSLKNYSERMSKDATEMQYCIKYKDTSVPVIALGWEEEFLTCKPLERTIRLIHSCFRLNLQELIKKQHYKNLHIINFEDLVTNPQITIEKLKNIIGIEPLPLLKKLLLKENVPRLLNEQEYQERKATIANNTSGNYSDLLILMDQMYQQIREL